MRLRRRQPPDSDGSDGSTPSPADQAASARLAGLASLARRAHTRHELRQKLIRKGFPREAVESSLDALEERGFLDDAKTATALAAWRARTGRGKGRIAAELVGKGVARAEVESAIASLDPEDEARSLRTALEKRARALPSGLTRRARSKKLFDHLVRRGFAPSAVLEALKRKGDATDDES